MITKLILELIILVITQLLIKKITHASAHTSKGSKLEPALGALIFGEILPLVVYFPLMLPSFLLCIARVS